MTLIQKIFVRVLPRKWAEDMEAESRRWMHCCRCGYERSCRDAGGIRWPAAGAVRNLMECPRCGQMTWHTCHQKLGACLKNHDAIASSKAFPVRCPRFSVFRRPDTLKGGHPTRLFRQVLKTPQTAFTLIELLVVIAVIGILAALLAPVLAAAKRKAAQIPCVNNLKQLGTAVMLYLDDNDGTFPGIASRNIGFHPEDWIYWRTNTALYPPVEQSPLARALGHADRTLFRCPLDQSDADRLSQVTDNQGPYLYSYSFVGFGLDENNHNQGLSSIFLGTSGSSGKYPFKQSSVRNPSAKIMFGEEPGSTDSQDSPVPNVEVIQDGRWIPGVNVLTRRHNKQAVVAFADGHAQAVPWEFGNSETNLMPGF
jgi:prepilin-type N-terminal cleavage/methylation domain-containing protein/prepilin-type processing-associated H-X9-DG protein